MREVRDFFSRARLVEGEGEAVFEAKEVLKSEAGLRFGGALGDVSCFDFVG